MFAWLLESVPVCSLAQFGASFSHGVSEALPALPSVQGHGDTSAAPFAVVPQALRLRDFFSC